MQRDETKSSALEAKEQEPQFCQEPLDKVAWVKMGADPMRNEGMGERL